MASSNAASIKTLVELKRKNEKLQEIATFLEMENLEYDLKRSRMENAISNVHKMIQSLPTKLVEASEHLYGILGTCGTSVEPVNRTSLPRENSLNKSKTSGKIPDGNLVVVNPHMVNGTFLYFPTINLTRAELHSQQNSEDAVSATENNQRSVRTRSVSLPASDTEAGPSTAVQDFSSDPETAHLEDASEASSSKSPHSTVLSGTFGEVTIYVNQGNQESLNEEPRKSVNVQRRSKNSKYKRRARPSSNFRAKRSR